MKYSICKDNIHSEFIEARTPKLAAKKYALKTNEMIVHVKNIKTQFTRLYLVYTSPIDHPTQFEIDKGICTVTQVQQIPVESSLVSAVSYSLCDETE